jgi:hypothetical protein
MHFKKLLFLLLFSLNAVAATVDVKTYIPTNARKYLPTVKQEQLINWKDHPAPAQLPSLIEHESCISLTNSRCWSPTSQLKTQREEGAGLGQITRAYDKTGKLRFDALTEIKNKHQSLNEFTWENVYSRPDLQIRAVILKSKDNYNTLSMITNPNERLKFSDAAYNGGMGGVQNERRSCQMKTGCNPQVWKGNVALVCLKSKHPLYGTRSACDINRYHVTDVTETRVTKYVPFMVDKPEILESTKKKSILNICIEFVMKFFK